MSNEVNLPFFINNRPVVSRIISAEKLFLLTAACFPTRGSHENEATAYSVLGYFCIPTFQSLLPFNPRPSTLPCSPAIGVSPHSHLPIPFKDPLHAPDVTFHFHRKFA